MGKSFSKVRFIVEGHMQSDDHSRLPLVVSSTVTSEVTEVVAHPLLVLWLTSAVLWGLLGLVAPAFSAFVALAMASVSFDEKALGRMEGSSTAKELVWDRSREPDDVFTTLLPFPVPEEPSTVKVTSFPFPPRPISDSRVEKDESEDSRREPGVCNKFTI